MSYRKYPPDMDGFGIVPVAIVVVVVVIAVVTLR